MVSFCCSGAWYFWLACCLLFGSGLACGLVWISVMLRVEALVLVVVIWLNASVLLLWLCICSLLICLIRLIWLGVLFSCVLLAVAGLVVWVWVWVWFGRSFGVC